jgi:hypothetical protein
MPIPTFYQIKIKGHLDQHWSDWFDGLTISHEAEGETILSGPVVDQAALFGLLTKVHNLNLTLICVKRVEPGAGGISSAPIDTTPAG